MEEQDLKDIWKRSSKNEEITINNALLITDFKNKMEHRERIVRRRDMKEYIAGAIGVVFYIYILIELPFSMSKLGAFLMILSMIYFVVRLYNNRKSKFTRNLFLPIKAQLLQQRVFMLRQSKLLRTVHWMFIPIFISFTIFVWGDAIIKELNDPITEFILVRKPLAKIIGTVFLLAYGIYIIRMNKRAAKVNWEPLIKDIDAIIETLDKEK
ncbi:hypothetical protein D7030_11230 [Flavobacteriaceae bacterium AU392]|nr:hypothetical protein D1817_13440 [Flavobacteriaceae bacterium]RKM82733.1 hypothetical protein D7030_11230 [Flavobacteriaceae bacterium AU392]